MSCPGEHGEGTVHNQDPTMTKRSTWPLTKHRGKETIIVEGSKNNHFNYHDHI